MLDPQAAKAGLLSQLERTFLANDCDMCIMAPKVIELERHPNVSILYQSALLGLDGQAGHFTAHISQPTGQQDIVVGAAILSPDYQSYDPSARTELGYGRYAGVVTGAQFDRVLSTSGPVAWLQCVGSRDRQHDYCSSYCCMDATKKAIMAKQYNPAIEPHIFIMDMRAFGKGYMSYYNQARYEFGVKYTRCRIASVTEDPSTRELILKYETEDAKLQEQRFKLVVLSTGIEVSRQTRELAERLGVALNSDGFCATPAFAPVETNRAGVFVAGSFSQPKDMHDTVTQASACAAKAAELLAGARGTESRTKTYPAERDISTESPRLGVFVCDYDRTIGKVVDIAATLEYAKRLPGVVWAEQLACSSESESQLRARITEQKLNRVIVASGTPVMHETIFREALREAGLNPYLLEMANLRDQCAWVHMREPKKATAKAKDLLRMAAARATRLQPVRMVEMALSREALILGGGAAGLNAALSLAQQGFRSYLIERDKELGGNLRHIYHDLYGNNVQDYMHRLIAAVENDPRITIFREATLLESSGFVGNFASRIRTPQGEQTLMHGALIIATGGKEHRGAEYALGQDSRILTHQELEERIAHGDPSVASAKKVVFIQCVGPAEEYCSRLCCSWTLKNSLKLKDLNPDINIYVLYKDIRAYGFREQFYTEAREKGVLFLRYDNEHLPQVSLEGGLQVVAHEPVLNRDIRFRPDLLVLSEGITPETGAVELAAALKLPLNANGFFIESHPKLQPADFATEGVYLCGLAHAPKSIEETIAQAQAAAARAATVLSRDKLLVGGAIAVVEQEKCVGCLTCVRICPYHVPKINPQARSVGNIAGAAEIEAALCQGCGICVGECPAKAIQLLHYRDDQVLASIIALREPEYA
jgi:heterodisulfide reductase subunit A